MEICDGIHRTLKFFTFTFGSTIGTTGFGHRRKNKDRFAKKLSLRKRGSEPYGLQIHLLATSRRLYLLTCASHVNLTSPQLQIHSTPHHGFRMHRKTANISEPKIKCFTQSTKRKLAVQKKRSFLFSTKHELRTKISPSTQQMRRDEHILSTQLYSRLGWWPLLRDRKRDLRSYCFRIHR